MEALLYAASAVRLIRESTQRAAFVRESREDAEYLHVFGEIDISNAGEFEAFVGRIGTLNRPMVVDLTCCCYIDSCMLHALARADKLFDLRVIAAKGSHVERVFELVDADEHLHITYKPVQIRLGGRI